MCYFVRWKLWRVGSVGMLEAIEGGGFEMSIVAVFLLQSASCPTPRKARRSVCWKTLRACCIVQLFPLRMGLVFLPVPLVVP